MWEVTTVVFNVGSCILHCKKREIVVLYYPLLKFKSTLKLIGKDISIFTYKYAVPYSVLSPAFQVPCIHGLLGKIKSDKYLSQNITFLLYHLLVLPIHTHTHTIHTLPLYPDDNI